MAEKDEPIKDRIIAVNIEDEMKTAYIDYSMSVIVSRALPDVRDGLKPVHRRVFFGMNDLGLASGKPHKKSARIVGEVLGKYHPHGDSSVYDTMVRLAQDWSLRYPMVDGQGNFGSIDGDNAAAMRYTEARLKSIAEEMLADIKKDTVAFRPNFDDSLEEPTVLPSKIPNLIVNGSSGIAVGMATNMAPHNLSETVDAITAYIDNNDIEIEQLITHIKAPDFPTGGIIYGYEGVRDAFMTGKGRIVLRGKVDIEEDGNRGERLVVTEIPYQVNKSQLIENVAELVQEKKIEGIGDIRDESDKNGIRIVFEIKRDANASIVLNNLYKSTRLQSSFSVNNIALVNDRPQLLNIKDLIYHFVEHRHDVVVKRTQFDLNDAEKKAHILEGLLVALDHLDEIIKLIRDSDTPEIAQGELINRYQLSEIQAKAILAMTLRRLTGLERDKIKNDYQELVTLMERLREILGDRNLRMQIIKEELIEVKQKYGDERRTDIILSGEEFDPGNFIVDEPVVITISHEGYIKRTPLIDYRRQSRGGKGSTGSSSKEQDFIEHLLIATNHNYLLVFTDRGQCHWLKVYEIPESQKNSKGRAVQNMLLLEKEEKIKAYLIVKDLNDREYLEQHAITLCTERGIIKKTPLLSYAKPRAGGIRAININEGDHLLKALITDGNSEIMMAGSSGKAVRFNEQEIRETGRTSMGVRGIKLPSEEMKVVGMIAISNTEEQSVMVISQKGYGKRTDIDEYRKTARGAKGVTTLKVTEKVGDLVGLLSVREEDELMIITKSGIAIRMAVGEIRKIGRATQGVRLIDLGRKDEIASVACIQMQDIPQMDIDADIDNEDSAEEEQ